MFCCFVFAFCCILLWIFVEFNLFVVACLCKVLSKGRIDTFPNTAFRFFLYKCVFYKNSRFHRCILCFMA